MKNFLGWVWVVVQAIVAPGRNVPVNVAGAESEGLSGPGGTTGGVGD